MVVEVILAVLVVVLAAATLAVFYLGLFGLVGVLRFARCNGCGRLAASVASRSALFCPSCSHAVLLHPLEAMHHVHPSHLGRHAA